MAVRRPGKPHTDRMRWIREYDADECVWNFIEVDDEGWVGRQVGLRGADRVPVTAAALNEVLNARDRGGIAAVQAYERRYGVVAEGNADDRDGAEGPVTEITARDFETVWAAARSGIESRDLGGGATPENDSDPGERKPGGGGGVRVRYGFIEVVGFGSEGVRADG